MFDDMHTEINADMNMTHHAAAPAASNKHHVQHETVCTAADVAATATADYGHNGLNGWVYVFMCIRLCMHAC